MSGPKWESISPQAKDLIRGLLELDPKKRLTAVEAIEHPWFTVRHRPHPHLPDETRACRRCLPA